MHGNSARSIFGEALLNYKGRPNFTAYSAGSHPGGFVRPEALKQIELAHMSTAGLRSKSWDEFAGPDAPRMNFVFTVCDSAAKEVCPLWPGQPMTAHWGVPDPAAITGYARASRLSARLSARLSPDSQIAESSFYSCALPLADLEKLAIKKQVDRIGRQ